MAAPEDGATKRVPPLRKSASVSEGGGSATFKAPRPKQQPPKSSRSQSPSRAMLLGKVKAVAARLFPEDREEEVDELIVSRLPAETPAAAAALVQALQDALDDGVRQRRRLVDQCVEVERQLLLDGGDGRVKEQHLNERVDELSAQVTSLRADKTAAVSSVEKRWRAKLDEVEKRTRGFEDELRKKLEAKDEEAAQLLYVNMANERRIAELTTKVSSATASAHVEEGDARRDAEEVSRLRAEVSRLTGVLEAKSNEVSTAMITFAEMQRMTVEREGELKAKLQVAEAKVAEAADEASDAKKELSVSKQELTAAIADVNSLRDRLADLRRTGGGEGGVGGGGGYAEIAELKSRLAVETSLKERAESREEAERQERIATNAQLVAVEQSKLYAIEEARADWAKRERKIVRPPPCRKRPGMPQTDDPRLFVSGRWVDHGARRVQRPRGGAGGGHEGVEGLVRAPRGGEAHPRALLRAPQGRQARQGDDSAATAKHSTEAAEANAAAQP